MYTSSLCVGALLSTTVLSVALPINIKFNRRQDLPVAQPSWTNSATGNLTLVFSDTTVGFGTVQPKDVIAQLGSQCWDAGTCDTSTYTQSGTVPASGGGGAELVVSATVGEGHYPPWAHNGIIDAFTAAVGAIQQSKQVTYNPSNCATQGCTYQEPVTIDQYTAPDAMSIILEDPAGGQPLGDITLSVSTSVTGDSGFCSTFTTVGAGVAAAISGPLAGAFTLLGLACQD